MTFKEGDRVVCVNDKWVRHQKEWNFPVLNEVYTVEFVMHDGAVTLEEIDNSHIDKDLHSRGLNIMAAFYSWHFKKVNQIQQENLVERELEVVNF